MTFDYTIPEPQFKDAETQKQALKLTGLLKQINESDNPDIHDKLNKEIHQTTMDLVSASAGPHHPIRWRKMSITTPLSRRPAISAPSGFCRNK